MTPASVEAAGIEPASRDISTIASTCVVDYLRFVRCTVHRQTEHLTRRERVLTVNVLDVLHSDLELVTSIQGSPAKPISRGYRFLKQPEPSYRWQVKFVIRFLRGLLINHDTPPALLAIRSNPIRPRLTSRAETQSDCPKH